MLEQSHLFDVVLDPGLIHFRAKNASADVAVHRVQQSRRRTQVEDAYVVGASSPRRPGVLQLEHLGTGNALHEPDAGLVELLHAVDRVYEQVCIPAEGFDDVEGGTFCSSAARTWLREAPVDVVDGIAADERVPYQRWRVFVPLEEAMKRVPA